MSGVSWTVLVSNNEGFQKLNCEIKFMITVTLQVEVLSKKNRFYKLVTGTFWDTLILK